MIPEHPSKQERMREALEEALAFMQQVGTEDPDDIDTMTRIEQLSGRITAALSDVTEHQRFKVELRTNDPETRKHFASIAAKAEEKRND